MYPYQHKQAEIIKNPFLLITNLFIDRWRFLLTRDSNCIKFIQLRLKINKNDFFEIIDKSCNKFQKTPENYLGNDYQNKKFFVIQTSIHQSNANAVTLNFIAHNLVELIDDESGLELIEKLVPPNEKNIFLVDEFYGYQSKYIQTNN
jgi:hypothetical protein